MSGFISLFMNLIDVGFNSSIVPIWAVEFFIVFTLILILAPIAQNIALVISGKK